MEEIFKSIPIYIKFGLFLSPLVVSLVQMVMNRRKINKNDFLLIHGVSITHNAKILRIQNKVYSDQLTYAKSILQEVGLSIFEKFRQDLPGCYEENLTSQELGINKDTLMKYNQTIFEEICKNALTYKAIPKFEFVFTDTDFSELTDLEEKNLTEEVYKHVINQVKLYIRNKYTHGIMIIPLDTSLAYLDDPEIEKNVASIFLNSKSYENKASKKVKELTIKFQTEVEELLEKPKKFMGK